MGKQGAIDEVRVDAEVMVKCRTLYFGKIRGFE